MDDGLEPDQKWEKKQIDLIPYIIKRLKDPNKKSLKEDIEHEEVYGDDIYIKKEDSSSDRQD
jgi:hypothetical protein